MLRERPDRDPIGPLAPVDLTGTTPLGWAAFRADKRPPMSIETTLFSPGDRSVLPLTPRFKREGSSGVKPSARKSVEETSDWSAAKGKSTKARSDGRQSPKISQSLSSTIGEVLFGFSEAAGWRPSMEDRTFVGCPLAAELPFVSAFGVLDGHGGDFSSSFLAAQLPVLLRESFLSRVTSSTNNSWSGEELRLVMTEAFGEAERGLREHQRMQVDVELAPRRKVVPVVDKSGSTAVVCCVTPSFVAVANVGDSRAVLARRSAADASLVAEPMSIDHKPSLPAETRRIQAAGGAVTAVAEGVHEVSCAGTDLKLRMSRAFGDFYLKQSDVSPAMQAICAIPDVTVVSRDASVCFLLLACDGVWDVMSNQQAVDLVAAQLGLVTTDEPGAAKSPAEACDALLMRCLELGTTDNMTAMVVVFESLDRRSVASASCDTPVAQLLSASSIGTAMRSPEETLVKGLAAMTVESPSIKKNLTLEFD